MKPHNHVSVANSNCATASTLLSVALAVWSVKDACGGREKEPARPAPTGEVAIVSSAASDKKAESYDGTVVDSMTGKPVEGIQVTVRRLVNGKQDGGTKLASDAAGRFEIEIPAAWASVPHAELDIRFEAPGGQITSYDRCLSDDILQLNRNVTIGNLRFQQKLGLPPPFGQVLLFPTKQRQK